MAPNHPSTMPRRRLGSSGLVVPELGLGCMGMSEFYGPGDEEESIRVIHRSIELGMNFLDTADVYGVGKNEELVGRAIKGKRDQVILATKFGNVRGADGSFKGVNGKPDYVRASCDGSLKRLGVDYIDLYYQHRVDPNTPIEETVGAMAELIRAGKVRFLGLSEASAKTLRKAAGVHAIAALQTEYSIWTRDVETDILTMCRAHGIGFVAYSPLGRGFLAGRFKKKDELAKDDWRHNNPRFQGENLDRNLELQERVQALATRKNCTPAQLALAWVLSRGEDVVAIPGTKRLKYLEENAATAQIKLSNAEVQEIDRMFPQGQTAGNRYQEMAMRAIDTGKP